MSLVTVLGDAATTTTLALAAGWPDEVMVLEADRRGGSLAAWLDLPSSPTLSTAVTRAADGGWPAIEAVAHEAPAGVRVVTAPVRTIEAARAVAEAERHVLPALSALDRPVVLVDSGRADLGGVGAPDGLPPVLLASDVTVVVHRQSRHSARAAAVRIERLADLVEAVIAASPSTATVLALIGDTPFEAAEIERFVSEERALAGVVSLADDPLAAAVLAGRSGVSARRLARLPLMRTARRAASVLDRLVLSVRGAGQVRIEPRSGREHDSRVSNGRRADLEGGPRS